MVARCLLDNDDEVRDRALLYLEVLKQKQKALSSAYILNSKCVRGGSEGWERGEGVEGRGRSGREERRSGREREEWEGEGGVGGQSEEKALQVVYMNGNMLLSLYLCCTVSEGQYFEPRVCCITN